METSITNISEIELTKEEVLHENKSLKKQLCDCQVVLDLKNQQIYDLKRDLSSFEALEAHYLQELEALQIHDNVESKQLKEEIQSLIESGKRSEETIKSYEDEVLKKNEEIEFLRKDVERLGKLYELGKDNIQTDYDKLLFENNKLKDSIDDNNRILDSMVELQLKYDQMCDERKKFDLELLDLQEHYNLKKDQVRDLQLFIENLQEESMLLKIELDNLKVKPLDSDLRGNSLFAEVNDRRVKLEKTMSHVKVDYIKMKNEHSALLEQIAKLQRENTLLTSHWKKDTEECKYFDENLLRTKEEEVSNLKKVIELYQKKLDEKYEITEEVISKDLFFMENMFRKKDKEIKELLDKIDGLSTNEAIMARNNRTLHREMCGWKAQSLKNDSTVAELKTEIEQMKLGDNWKSVCNCESKGASKMSIKNRPNLFPDHIKNPVKVNNPKAILLSDKTNEPTNSDIINNSETVVPVENKVSLKSKENKGVKFSAETKQDDGKFVTRRRGIRLTSKNKELQKENENIE